MDPELEPRPPDFQPHAFLLFLKCAWKVPWALKGMNLLWETEQLCAREKLIGLGSAPRIALCNSPTRDHEFVLGSGRGFLPMRRLSPLKITNTASSSKRKRLINVSSSEKEVLWSCYFYSCFQFIFHFEINKQRTAFVSLEDEHINVTPSGRLAARS